MRVRVRARIRVRVRVRVRTRVRVRVRHAAGLLVPRLLLARRPRRVERHRLPSHQHCGVSSAG